MNNDPRSPAPWVTDAVTPEPGEVERVESPLSPEMAAAAGVATTPSDRETSRLVARLTAVAPRRRQTPTWALAPAAALVIVGIWIGAREVPQSTEEATSAPRPVAVFATELSGPVPPAVLPPAQLELGVPTELESASMRGAGPSVTFEGNAEFTLTRLTELGPQIELQSGHLDITVDPEGRQRALSVVAGDVTVSVMGTVFRMERAGEDVRVWVRRGRVRVDHAGAFVELGMGETWSRPRVVAVAPTPRRSTAESSSPTPGLSSPTPEFSSPTPAAPEVASAPTPAPVSDAAAAAKVFAGIMTGADQGESSAAQRVKLDDFLERFPDSVLAGEAEKMRDALDLNDKD
jgi:hypothetical protein